MSRSLKAKNTGMNSRLLFTIFLTFLCQLVVSEDYYELLGISRDASNTEIRKAFKKLALKLHPDKNTEDPQAHEKFTEINKAYEVLKDEELRKKYDVYGEEGLKDDHFGGGHYQSWNYFNEEFGIYDDDPEIITLSYSDFEVSVEGSDDIWFINFYSPYCSHCHDLAPAWREVARELEGVLRIGAVNCQEEWNLCRQQGIQSYPSLVLYPTHEFHHGSRTTKALVQFILDSLEVNLFDLWDGNFEEQIKQNDQPWLIDFCAIGEDCISQDTRIKVSAILDNLVNIGVIDCGTNSRLCEEIGYNDKLVYFKSDVGPEKGEVIDSLETKEIVGLVLKKLPDPVNVDLPAFENIKKNLAAATEIPWVLHFDKGPMDNLEMRKLPAFTTDVNVGHVDCSKEQEICRQVHVRKYPMVALFKTHGHYEWHHGRFTAHDIAVFAKESASSSVQTLGPDDFPAKISKPDLPFFVDFFAPWCPPCMRLLPEYRKAARSFDDSEVGFGTVDCTIHINLCHMYNIRSYPTTILYNNSIPHQFSGHHTAADLVEFVENTLKPSVIQMTPETFQSLVAQRNVGETWLVDFYAPWCGPCNELAPEWNKLAKQMKDEAGVGSIDCQKYRWFCQEQGVNSYPTIRLYPHNSQGGYRYVSHRGWRDVHSLYSWAFQHLPSLVTQFNYHSFHENVLASEDAWIIDFYAPWCGHCVQFAPDFEKAAKLLDGRVKAGKVDCEQDYHLCSEAGVRAYPTVKIYLGSPEKGMTQPVNGHLNVESQNPQQIQSLALRALKDYKEDLASRKSKKTKSKKKHRGKPDHDEF
ncbi:dnaJ homolog subfamily C member 10-like [Acropora millepora]|uniref:dnaJ homolog subfamily C member 10-like n=1 Tax=Acropora millepora TaxID=45264 RepID=UPI001CF3EE9F|nr:dnaJ homolog subfamily C member 10-like [Acropora millepora]